MPRPCPSCNGSGTTAVQCHRCGGTGRLGSTLKAGSTRSMKWDDVRFEEDCPICVGCGWEQKTCHHCHGAGVI